ncbi:HD-GYP domain-containing protein [Marinobacter xestospongiae]|uniref:HD-GYP domain-containing protein n=1 Tax=Marinobacter xestospongiae TaxID=994319 RepID=UPI002003ECBB|nr:HD domain-containing protein [Marinobacter xestospongiae]
MTNLVRVAPGALVVGKPLPWTVYDAHGRVLLTQGYVIHSNAQLEQLFEQGLFHPRMPEKKETPEATEDVRDRNPFYDYPVLLNTLEATLNAITAGEASAFKRLLGLTRLVQRSCQEAPDPCLALVHLYSVEPTAFEHTLFHAIVCQMAADQLGLDNNRASILVAAALTANIALHPILDRLNASPRTLSDDQRDIIHRHPERSAQALSQAGIDNSLLLDIVRQHHERADGAGYPRGLEGGDLLPEAELLSYAELYVALITRRGYRPRLSIGDARKSLREAGSLSARPRLCQALLAALTPYPPGCLVRLANNEVAVVTHRPQVASGHRAQAIISAQGDRYLGAFQRHCQELDYNIRAQVEPDVMPSMDFGLLWGFG